MAEPRDGNFTFQEKPMITVQGPDDLPAPPPASPERRGPWMFYYVRSMSAPNVVIEGHSGDCYALASGEWEHDGYKVFRDADTGRITRQTAVAFEHSVTPDKRPSRKRDRAA